MADRTIHSSGIGWDVAVLAYDRQEYDSLMDRGFGRLPYTAKEVATKEWAVGRSADQVGSWTYIPYPAGAGGRRFDWVVYTERFWQRPDARDLFLAVSHRLVSGARIPLPRRF